MSGSLGEVETGGPVLNIVPRTGGNAIFDNAVGGITPLTSFTTNGGTAQLSVGSINTTGAQTYNNFVRLLAQCGSLNQ